MSSVIRGLYYKPKDQELSIWFGPEFLRYKYFDVPPQVYQGLRDAPSRGRYFNALIKDRYECVLASPSPHRNRRWQAIRSAS